MLKPIKKIARSGLVSLADRLGYRAISRKALRYERDGLYTIHATDFLEDERFRRAYEAGRETGSWGEAEIPWRIHVQCWAAERGTALEGDFVECGVNRGGSARAVMEYVDFETLDRSFWLLDTFDGLVERYISPEERARGIRPGMYEECHDFVQRTFEGTSARIVRGPVPDTLPEVDAERVAYLHIDMNCAEPEIAAAEHFWDRLVPGAIVVLDDYGWARRVEQRSAFQTFAREHGITILSLPTGQGMFVKP